MIMRRSVLIAFAAIVSIFIGCGNQTNKRKGNSNTIVSSEKTIVYKDALGYEFYFKLLPDGSALFAPTTDPSEIEKLGDIARHEQYLNPERGYYDKGSDGCLYKVVFDGDTFYVANDGYIYTSYSAWRSKNHNSAFKIISNE